MEGKLLLAQALTGLITPAEFRELLDKQLAELRSTPEMTEEREMLSKVELYLHEADEGLRDTYEPYLLALSLLEG